MNFANPSQLANEYQANVRCDARSLESDLQESVERKLKRLVFLFTHWVTLVVRKYSVQPRNDTAIRRR